jgi:hypothetical protein
MQTECTPKLFEFEAVEGRAVVAEFDGRTITSNAGMLTAGAIGPGSWADAAVCPLLHRSACPAVGRAQSWDAGEPARIRTGARISGAQRA